MNYKININVNLSKVTQTHYYFKTKLKSDMIP